MTLQEVLDKTVRFFKDKNVDSPRLDAELLLAKAMGFRRIDLYLKFDQPMGDEELTRCRDFVRRRSQGEPVAYILGEKDFYGQSFQVDARVLIPRPETELLAEAAITFWKEKAADELAALSSDNQAPVHILDLGCGSGCLGLSVLSKTPAARLTAVDLSVDALNVTRANAERMGLQDRCELIGGDAGSVDLGSRRFDVILANPPYIAKNDPRVQSEVDRFEPHLALYAADQGLACIQQWSRHALPFLNEQGWIGFEFGAGQENQVAEYFQGLGLTQVKLIKDLAGLPRHVVARKGL